jgi:hypothetical protein
MAPDQVQMQRRSFDASRGVVGEPRQMIVRVAQFQRTELILAGEQLLRAFQVAVEKHTQPKLQVSQQSRMQIFDFGHPRNRKMQVVPDLLVRHVDQDALDDVARVLHVDRELDDVGPAFAFPFVQRLAADLGQVQFDRRIKIVDHVVHLAQPFRELQVIGAQHRQHAVEHDLNDVAQAQRFARRAAHRQRGRLQCGGIEILGLARGILRFVAGKHALGEPRNRPYRAEKHDRQCEIEPQMKVNDLAFRLEAHVGEPLADHAQQRQHQHASGQFENQVAQRHSP